MKQLNFVMVLAVLMLLAGCMAPMISPLMAVATTAPSKSLGEPVNFDYAKTITPKITTRTEVLGGMGKPALVTQDGNTETWKYEHRIRPGAFDVLTHQSRVNHAGDSTVVTVVFRGDIVVAVAGNDFNQDKGTEVKFSKGETQLIPIYQGGGQMITIPQTAPAQSSTADTTGASQQVAESPAPPAAATQNQTKPSSSKPKKSALTTAK